MHLSLTAELKVTGEMKLRQKYLNLTIKLNEKEAIIQNYLFGQRECTSVLMEM